MSTGRSRTVLPPVEQRSATPGKTARVLSVPELAGNSDPGQLDLFDQPAGDMNAAPGALQSSINPAAMSDEELLLGFAKASLGSVEPLAREILRRQPKGWTDAAATLWERFLGFGTNVPMPEQVAVLGLVHRTAAAPLLIQLLRRAPMAYCLDPHLLPACRRRLRRIIATSDGTSRAGAPATKHPCRGGTGRLRIKNSNRQAASTSCGPGTRRPAKRRDGHRRGR